ncbi:hypothetical protein [Bilophila wadsworthia]|uniref:hypothetical protein n=1 Tax=Bilophila wadsworthia TaxID=35833 RepID=UPI00242B3BC7|nr:hypothetical protein [Bilophila wadsworthia]
MSRRRQATLSRMESCWAYEAKRNLALGCRVHSQQGNATETSRVLQWRGGMLMSRSRISPRTTASRCSQMASMCQPWM